MLEKEAVQDGIHQIAQTGERDPPQHFRHDKRPDGCREKKEHKREERKENRDAESRRDRNFSRSDRTVFLSGMKRVGLSVKNVVQNVDRA